MPQDEESAAEGLAARRLVTDGTSKSEAIVCIEAVEAESQGEATMAGEQYRQLTERVPDDLMMRIELADFLKRQGQNQPAIAAYQEALGLDAGYSRLHVDLCQIYVRLDDYPLAEQRANSALEGFRGNGHRGGEAQALLCLGDAQRTQGGGARLTDARRNIESAGAIFESLGQKVQSLTRVSILWTGDGRGTQLSRCGDLLRESAVAKPCRWKPTDRGPGLAEPRGHLRAAGPESTSPQGTTRKLGTFTRTPATNGARPSRRRTPPRC